MAVVGGGRVMTIPPFAQREEWGTVGVSGNIVEASLAALVDSMEYSLVK